MEENKLISATKAGSLELVGYVTGKLFCMDEDVQINGDFSTNSA